MEPITLKVDELRIRPWQESDLPALTAAYADPEIIRRMMMPQPWGPEHSWNFIAHSRNRWDADSPRWAVVDDNDTLLGGVGLTAYPQDEYAVMYWTTPEARGRNVATRALREACRFAFDQIPNSHRLYWDAIVGNHLSRLVALKVGFQEEGITREGGYQRGTWRDLWVGGMLRRDFREAGEEIDAYPRLAARAALFHGPQPTVDLDFKGAHLRPLSEDDLDDLTTTCQTPEVQKWTTVPRHYTRDDAVARLQAAQHQWTLGNGATWAISDQAGRYCGTVGIHMHKWHEPAAWIDFYAAPWARGQGLMTPALQALTEFSSQQMRNDWLDWGAYAGNDASWHLAKKVGFAWHGIKQVPWRYDRTKKVDIWKASLLH